MVTRLALIFVVLACLPVRVTHGRETKALNTESLDGRGNSASSVDLRPRFKERGLTVRHQGKRGSCQVFALLGIIEYQLSQTDKPVELSEQFLMWAANEANGMERTEGFFPEWLIKGLRKHGVCQEGLMHYVGANVAITEPSRQAREDASARTRCRYYEIKYWKTDVGYTDAHIRRIIDVLREGEPVTATFRWAFGTPDPETYDDDFFYLDRNIRFDVGGHGVIIVGFKRDESVAGGGYFVIRNSWGTGFGDDGHVKVSFAFAKRHGMDAYRVTLDADKTHRDKDR